MKKFVTISIIRIILMFLLARPVYGNEIDFAPSAYLKSINSEPSVIDERIIKLNDYLTYHQSPLAFHADYLVKQSDIYNLPDWKMVPAIAGVESTFGKVIPNESYNAWGWANGNYYFKSWPDAINTVTKTLKYKYINQGLNTVEKIAHVYAPPSQTWANKVTYFMQQIDVYQPQQPHSLLITL